MGMDGALPPHSEGSTSHQPVGWEDKDPLIDLTSNCMPNTISPAMGYESYKLLEGGIPIIMTHQH